MNIFQEIQTQVQQAFPTLFGNEVELNKITINETPKDFIGDITLVVFPLLKLTKKNPEESAKTIGEYLVANNKNIIAYNIIKGFLNLEISNEYWINFAINPTSEIADHSSETILIEYSSPNTNKPIHLGHMRNNVLGYALAGIFKANNYKVVKANLVNDRGIHICKSMIAWQKFGNGETPENTTDVKCKKGDHLVGKYYVKYNTKLKAELNEIYKLADIEYKSLSNGKSKSLTKDSKIRFIFDAFNNAFAIYLEYKRITTYSRLLPDKKISPNESQIRKKEIENIKNQVINTNKEILDYLSNLNLEIKTKNYKKIFDIVLKSLEQKAPIHLEAQEMLLKWENNDAETISLWTTMNNWVYAGFERTYKNLGVDFDKFYYESNTYLLGKDIVEDGLQRNVFFKKEDGSVWIDLTADGLDQKLVLRADGTSVYITQDLGTADLKYNDFKMDRSIYVVGNEQDYHFKVLKLILQKLGRPYADGIQHFSYGMVDLPSGKMKSREGTVVDADDLIDDMLESAKEQTEALGKIDDFTEDEKTALFRTIGLGALKFFLLRVDPKKRILFDPKESIDLQGYTGPFVQYTYARSRSILRKIQEPRAKIQDTKYQSSPAEIELIKVLYKYEIILEESCKEMNPAKLIDYTYEVAKTYNKFYNECPILAAEKEEQKNFRILLTEQTGNTIKKCFEIVGIEVPERM